MTTIAHSPIQSQALPVTKPAPSSLAPLSQDAPSLFIREGVTIKRPSGLPDTRPRPVRQREKRKWIHNASILLRAERRRHVHGFPCYIDHIPCFSLMDCEECTGGIRPPTEDFLNTLIGWGLLQEIFSKSGQVVYLHLNDDIFLNLSDEQLSYLSSIR